MDSRLIQLTSAARKHGNLNLSTCGVQFFPDDVFGGSTRKNLGNEITINAEDIYKNIETDINKKVYDNIHSWPSNRFN